MTKKEWVDEFKAQTKANIEGAESISAAVRVLSDSLTELTQRMKNNLAVVDALAARDSDIREGKK